MVLVILGICLDAMFSEKWLMSWHQDEHHWIGLRENFNRKP